MSGHRIITDEGGTNRRTFLKQIGGLLAVPALLQACGSKDPFAHITGQIVGAAANVGHKIRKDDGVPPPEKWEETDTLIVGGGVAGLSAARWLAKQGITNVIMTEMADKTGGNAAYGRNHVSAYPWGAHYLPVPDVANTDLVDFLKDAGVITGYKDGLPIYNDYHLCHDPEERLFINGTWQEGLVPDFGVPPVEKQQIGRFFGLIDEWRAKKGRDGRYVFSIPVDTSSADEEWRALDEISFNTYLQQNGFSSPYLLWYLEYGCKDDYGCNLKGTSAWAGLHYFAARRGKGANANHSTILTWPEGNGFLSDALRTQCKADVRENWLVHRIHPGSDFVEVTGYDVATGKGRGIKARKVLLCTPQYVNRYLLGNEVAVRQVSKVATYAPWVVANLTLSRLPQRHGTPLCWDNVLYGQESVGYVFANHQNLRPNTAGVITWYLPLPGNAQDIRRKVYETTWAHWRDKVLNELNFAHSGIAEAVKNIDVWVWGHGMIQPAPGYIWGSDRQAGQMPVAGNRIFFAHSDLSGISIFEEAFAQGIRAAKEILAT